MAATRALATAVIRAAYVTLLPTPLHPGAEFIQPLVELVSGHRAKSNMRRTIVDGIDALARTIEREYEHEFRNVDAIDKGAALRVVQETFDTDFPDGDQILSALNNPVALNLHLAKSARANAKRQFLSDAATELAVHVAMGCAATTLSIVQEFQEFRDRRDWKILFTVESIHDRLESAISDAILPSFRAGTDAESVSFDAIYQQALVSRTRTVQVLGLPVDPVLNRHHIDEIVIPTTASHLLSPGEQKIGRIVEHQRARRERPLDDILASLLEDKRKHGSKRGVRMLLLGEAGCGKSTFAQWITYRIATQNLGPGLQPALREMPFFVQVRNLFGKWSDPPIDELVKSVYSTTSPPGGWLESRLMNGWLIVDGLDEIGHEAVDNVLAWLSGILDRYPRLNVILTCRPQDPYLSELIRLNEYDVWQVDRLTESLATLAARKWFDSLFKRDPGWMESDVCELLTDELSSPHSHVNEIATTPLVVSMLCAFYATGHDSGVTGRAQLYGEVCRVLVHIREYKKGIRADDRFQQDIEAKLRVLGALAIEILKQGHQSIRLHRTRIELLENSDLPRTQGGSDPSSRRNDPQYAQTGEDVVGAALLRLAGYSEQSPMATLQYLTRRSSVFIKVSKSEGSFVHRTIMEHLAAQEFVKRDEISQLLEFTNSWGGLNSDSVILTSAALANEQQAKRILKSLVARTQTPDMHAREDAILLLIRAAAATGVADADLRIEINQLVSHIVPPRTPLAAEQLASHGVSSLRWFKPPPEASDDIFEACLVGAILVGGNSALPLVAELSRDGRAGRFASRFIDGWIRFSIDDYAMGVLSNVALGNAPVEIRTERQLERVTLLSRPRSIRIRANIGEHSRHDISSLDGCGEVDISQTTSVEDFTRFRLPVDCRRLIASSSGLRSLRGLRESSLVELWADRCSSLQELEGLESVPGLRVLSLDNAAHLPPEEFDRIRTLSMLLTLRINDCSIDGSAAFLSALPNLRRLHARTRVGFTSLDWLRSMPSLRHLELKTGRADSIDTNLLAPLSSLQSLDLGPFCPADAMSSFLSIRGLRSLGCDSTNLVSLRGVGGASIERLRLTDSSLITLEGVSRFDSLKHFDLSSSTTLESLDGLEDCESISEVVLDGCRGLRDISALAMLPKLRRVSLLDGVSMVDPYAVLADRINRGEVVVDHDPWDPSGQVSE